MSQKSPAAKSRNNTARRGRANVAAIIIILLALVLGAAFGVGLYALPQGDKIAEGVSLQGENLGGLMQAEARSIIADTLARETSREITLKAGDDEEKLTLSDLGVSAETDASLQAVYDIGRAGNIVSRVTDALRARGGITIDPVYSFDDKHIPPIVAHIAKKVNNPPVEATAKWDDSTQSVVISPSKVGGKLDEKESIKMIREAASSRIADSLTLPYREKHPSVTGEMMQSIDTVLGTYTTSFATSSSNRASNVETATRAINGAIVKPGEVFSYNKVVGPRTSKEGFRIAPVIIDGQLKPGMGGGICQVSTTLYNAALLANMRVVQRSHHSLPVHYAPPGQDATVSYGSIDLKLGNPTDYHMLIEARAAGRRLTIRVLGKGPAPKVRIERRNIYALPGRTVTVKDPTLPKGTRKVEKQGTSGRAVTVVRIVGEGPDAKSETLSRDRYLGEATVVRVGTGEPKPGSQPEPTTPEPESNTAQ